MSINDWLTQHPPQPGHGARDPERQDLLGPPSDTSDHKTNPDISGNGNINSSNPNTTAILLEIRKYVKHMNTKFDNLDKKVK